MMAANPRTLTTLIATFGLVMGCTTSPTTAVSTDSGTSITLPAFDPGAAPDVRTLLDGVTRTFIDRDPEWATELGLATGHDALTARSPEHLAAMLELALNAQQSVSGVALSTDEERLSVDIMNWWLDDIVRGAEFRHHEYAASFITGAHVNLPEFLIDIHPMRNAADADDYLRRLEALATVIDQVAEAVGRASESGHLMPSRVREIARWQVDAFLSVSAERQPLVTEFRRRMDAASIDESSERQSHAVAILGEDVIPAYRRLAASLEGSPVRASAGVWDLPNGADYYRWVLHHHTTMDIEPNALHEWGLTQVERVRADLATALEDLRYDTTDLNRALGLAISDAGTIDLGSAEARARFIASSRDLTEAVESATSQMFNRSPEADLIIQRPDPSREGGTGAWYRGPDLSGGRPGIYYLAMGAPTRSAHNHATTTVHEGVPGHHFQLALQAELDNPLHQRAVGFTGFAEGWALYAERLAWEAGVYDADPFGNIGRLQMELLRAARVVVDTGIHELRWTREEATDYLANATGLERGSAQSEVDRYIVWPGQATAYLVGMDQILQARSQARDALGDQFDLAEFHDVVLSSGSLPLPLLRKAVDRWIAGKS